MKPSFLLPTILFLLLCIAFVTLQQQEPLEQKDAAADTTLIHEDRDYVAPDIPEKSKVFFLENFNENPFQNGRWVPSKDPKYNGEWKWSVEPGTITGFPGDKGLLLTEPARHYAIAHKFDKELISDGTKDLVIQYEVKYEKKIDCGGSYIKLLQSTPELDIEHINNETPYIIMFGPDYCGATNKVHFIFRHQNPKNGVWEEKHLKNPPRIKNDELSHVYTLIIRKDQTFEIFIDQESARNGSLLTDFDPPVNPPKEIDDPTDVKPSDWVDEEYIDDPSAVKPEDWDEDAPMEIVDENDSKPSDWLDNEPEFIRDPEATKPEEWNEEEDGEWEAPLIRNPKCENGNCGEWKPRMIKNPNYKGKWYPPKIPNPAYKGEWKPRQIPNPDYFEDKTPNRFPPMGALALELWTMQGNILFDNFLICFDEQVAKSYAQQTWALKFERQKAKLSTSENESVAGGEVINGLIEQIKNLYEEYPAIVIVATALTILLSTVPFFFLFRGKKETDTKKEKNNKKEDTKANENGATNKNESTNENKSTNGNKSTNENGTTNGEKKKGRAQRED
jgi:calnexin